MLKMGRVGPAPPPDGGNVPLTRRNVGWFTTITVGWQHGSIQHDLVMVYIRARRINGDNSSYKGSVMVIRLGWSE